jgi:TatD DNase family protein
MKFVDAHIHLSDPGYINRTAFIVEEAKRVNVVALVSNSVNLETSSLNIKLAKENPGLVYAAVGIHPWNVTKLTTEELQQTLDLILQHRANREAVVAIGEVGLDPHTPNAERARTCRSRSSTRCLVPLRSFLCPLLFIPAGAQQK